MGLAALGAGAALAMGGATAIGATAAAIGAGTLAALDLGTIFTAVATVGSVVGAVGAVTGVKELKTAGMVLGGIGGIGSLASAVGAFGDGATMSSVFGSDAAGSSIGGNISETTGMSVSAGDSLIGGNISENTGLDVVDSAAKMYDGALTTDSAGNAINLSPTGTETAMGGNATGDNLASVGVNPPAGDTSAMLPDTVNKGSQVSSNSKFLDSTSSPSAGSQTLNPATDTSALQAPPGISTSDFAKLREIPNPVEGQVVKLASGPMQFTNGSWGLAPSGGLFSNLGGISNGAGMLGMGVIQAAGSLLSSSLDSLKPAQVAAYQAQAKANNAAAALQEKQNANMGQPIPVARSMAVTGTVAPPPKPGGLMNSTGAMV